MSALTAPSRASATALLLTENWLRNVFPSDLYAVEERPAFPDSDEDRPPALIVSHAHAAGEADRVPLLVVEVSDVLFEDYPGEEAGRFAAAGVRDYWVIEVAARRVHIFRDPRPDPEAKYGHCFGLVRACSPYSLVSPLVAELHLAQVINLLPW
jgi:Uma2 family endonuclease